MTNIFTLNLSKQTNKYFHSHVVRLLRYSLFYRMTNITSIEIIRAHS